MIVVGAGPAGAATAILLAERGVSVLVLDRAELPRRKICGEYLSPEAVGILDRLGILKMLDAAGAAELAGMRITAPDGTTLLGSYRAIGAWRPYRGHALAVSRTTLDGALVERLRALPVGFRERVRVTDVVVEGGDVVGVTALDAKHRALVFRAPLVVAADGRNSTIAARLGLRAPHRLRRMAIVTHVTDLPACGGLGEIFIDPPDYAILNPLASDRVNLSVVVPLDHAAPWSGRLDAFLAARVRQMPHLARRLAGARRVGAVQAMGPLAYRVRPPRVGGVLLVGDASGFYDPFTGEGIFGALRCAEMAADVAVAALLARDCSARRLAAYERTRRQAFRGKERVARALQFLIRRRRLADLAAHTLAWRPALLDLLLGVLGDYVPPGALLRGARAR